MKIGIVGLGIIGSACKFGFEKLGHKVYAHDIQLDTKLEDLLNTSITYICVPTPSKEDGSCDTSIVESVINDLKQLY
jgi:UDP-glucose 6-dehydrogenase